MKKSFLLLALLCIVIALTMFTIGQKENVLNDLFLIPLILGSVFLFVSAKSK